MNKKLTGSVHLLNILLKSTLHSDIMSLWCFWFIQPVDFSNFSCYGAFRAGRRKLYHLRNQHKYEFLTPPRSNLSSSTPPNWKYFTCTEAKTCTVSSFCLGLDHNNNNHNKKTSPELDRPRPASQPASPQPLSRRAKMHQSLLILAAPELWSGLQFEAMSSAIGPACCSTVWKHNAGILMDRTACPLSPMAIHNPHTHTHTRTYIHTHTHRRASTGRPCAHIKARDIFPWRPD